MVAIKKKKKKLKKKKKMYQARMRIEKLQKLMQIEQNLPKSFSIT